jgi:hypothetical protein
MRDDLLNAAYNGDLRRLKRTHASLSSRFW